MQKPADCTSYRCCSCLRSRLVAVEISRGDSPPLTRLGSGLLGLRFGVSDSSDSKDGNHLYLLTRERPLARDSF
jgi:hypothetical protein